MDLEDTDPEVFGIFVNWLYTQKLVNSLGDDPTVSILLKLWILGNRFLAQNLQNQTLDRLDKLRFRKGLPSSSFCYVYKNTAVGSPLRRYLVDLRSIDSMGLSVDKRDYPPQMLVDIVNAMRRNLKRTVWKRFTKTQMEKYHLSEIEQRGIESDESEIDSTSSSGGSTNSHLLASSTDSDIEYYDDWH